MGFVLSCVTAVALPHAARADELPLPRVHAGFAASGGFANAGPTWMGGVGFEGYLGARFAEWFALDATVFLENCLFCGRSNVGGMLVFLPGEVFTLATGGGVGGLYVLRWGIDAETASYGFGMLRTGFRVARDRTGVLSVGAEGMMGSTYAGTLSGVIVAEQSGYVDERPLGQLVGGARIFFGLETN